MRTILAIYLNIGEVFFFFFALVHKFKIWRLTEMTIGHRCNTVKQGWG